MTTLYDLDGFENGGLEHHYSTIPGELAWSSDVHDASGNPLPDGYVIGAFRPGWNSIIDMSKITQIGLMTKDDTTFFSGSLYQDSNPNDSIIDGGIVGVDPITFLGYNPIDHQVHSMTAAPYTFTGTGLSDLGSMTEGPVLGIPEPATAIMLGGALVGAASYALGKKAVRSAGKAVSGLVKRLF